MRHPLNWSLCHQCINVWLKICTNFCQIFLTVASQICWLELVTSWVSSFSTEKRICATWLWRVCALWPVRNFPTKPLRRTSKLSSMHWRFCIVHNDTLYCLLSRQQMFVLLLLAYMWSLSLSQTERDVSVRQRAADLLYAMCDRSNAKQIVAEMLSYLETADYSIREEMVRVYHVQP